MTNTKGIKIAIIQSGLSRKEIASNMGISLYSLHKKIRRYTYTIEGNLGIKIRVAAN